MSEQTQKVCPDGSVPQVPTAQPKEPKADPKAGPKSPKITRSEKTYKPKDPRRVEAGKRLAAISKSAKEKKARDLADRKRSASGPTDEDHEDRGESPLLDWTIPAGGLVVAGIVGLYYAYTKKGQPTDTKANPPKDEEPKERPRRSLDSFDD